MFLTELDSLITLAHVVVEGTDIQLVTSVLIAHDPLVLVWMVKTLNRSVTFCAFDSFRTRIPSQPINESFAIFRCILEQIWRSSEVSRVMGEVTAL